jgi:VanZ family protein
MVTVMGIIFYLSHQPGNFVQLPQFTGVDKLLHAIAYGILTGAFLYGMHPFTHESHRALTVIGAVLLCLLFGISDEYHQAFIPGRFVSGWDVAADCFGGLLVAGFWYRRFAGKAQRIVLDKK